MRIEIKPHKWDEHGHHYKASFFPFVDGKPRRDLANCELCEFYIPDGHCRKEHLIPNEKGWLFCGPICGYFALREVRDGI